MNYIAHSLPMPRTVKSEHSHKDKKQKSPLLASDERSKQESDSQPETETPELAAEPLTANTDEQTFEERRCGEDRRQKNITRGRWLDSRGKQDRRKPLDICFKI